MPNMAHLMAPFYLFLLLFLQRKHYKTLTPLNLVMTHKEMVVTWLKVLLFPLPHFPPCCQIQFCNRAE